MTTSELTSVAAIYDATAPVYDNLTAGHDYELWLGNLVPALERDGLRKGSLLDVCCGTGKSFLPMLARGWTVTGVDISEQMLERARAKAPTEVDLHCLDARRLPVLGSFDLAWALDDALNYLDSAEELHRALAGVRSNLGAGGLCVFDLNTITSYRGFWASRALIDGSPRLLWQGLCSTDFSPGDVARAALRVLDPEPGQTAEAIHCQRHFPEPVVRESLALAQLELLAVYGICTDAVLEQPLDESRHTKAIYVACARERR
jgi:SAM-dependent methyltransferase